MTGPGSSVRDVLLARLAAGSRPGARNDRFQVALAIEGGGNRAAYSAGMCIALEELGLTDCFDTIYGTSGGALNGAWLLTGEGQRWLPSWAWDVVAAAGVTDPRRLLRGGPLIDLDVLVGKIYGEITPMDFAAILANPITFHPVATDARTGEAVDLAPYLTDPASLQTALRATTCLPLLAGAPVKLGGHRLVDGGLSEAVPWPLATAQGATHVLVLRTRREGELPVVSRLERLALAPYFLRHAPGAGRSHRDRHLRYRDIDTADCANTELMQVRPPPEAHVVSRLSKDRSAIARAIDLGRMAALETLGSQAIR